MRLLIISLCILSFLYKETVYGIDIILKDTPVQVNTDVNIQGARLIEKYLLSFINDLQQFKENNGILQDAVIEKYIKDTQLIIFDLRKIQTNKVEKNVAEGVMKFAISEMKRMNDGVKKYLKNKSNLIKEETKILQEKYSTVLIKMNTKLQFIIESLRVSVNSHLWAKETELQILSHIKDLAYLNTKLKDFKYMEFRNKTEIKKYLFSVLGNIKKEIQFIKSLMQ